MPWEWLYVSCYCLTLINKHTEQRTKFERHCCSELIIQCVQAFLNTSNSDDVSEATTQEKSFPKKVNHQN